MKIRKLLAGFFAASLLLTTACKDDEIFENDIVKCGYGIGKVIFHRGSFMVEWISDKEANMELLNSRKGIYARTDDELFEVIGNSIENPELLSV